MMLLNGTTIKIIAIVTGSRVLKILISKKGLFGLMGVWWSAWNIEFSDFVPKNLEIVDLQKKQKLLELFALFHLLDVIILTIHSIADLQ